MNEAPETEYDLEKLFLPAWAQEAPGANKYAGFTGDTRPERRQDDNQRPRRPRPAGPRPGGGRPPDSRADGGNRGGPKHGRPDRARRFEPREPREPLPPPPPPLPIKATILPDDKGMESLARQIRITGRAYPLFDIAQLILQKPERQMVRWDVTKDATGKIIQPLYLCALDDSLWLSEDEAVAHLLSRNFETFYKTEKTATEPPKGTYTFVAQCGMSGLILGPPNLHDYQTKLHKLHGERFARMPFDAFKARVKIVKDEAVVKKWIEEQSVKTQFTCLNLPEPLALPNMEAVEQHFRQTHLPNLIKQVESHTMSGPAGRQVRSPGLQRLLRATWEEQRRFPLKLATNLSQQFASHGLQFFKGSKSITYVSVARPRFLDMEATPVSEGVRRIVDFINATTKCSRKKLIEALVPTVQPVPAAAAESPQTTPPPALTHSPAEETALASDLHWLIHEGHVIEFANGIMETAKKPVIRPPKPQPAAPAANAAPAVTLPEAAAPQDTPPSTADLAPEPVSLTVAVAEPSSTPSQIDLTAQP